MRGVDLNRFQFDYDLTFAVLMQDSDGRTLARFGSHPPEAMSIAGLKAAMRRVLALPKGGEDRDPARGAPRLLEHSRVYRESRMAREPCAHCHYANDVRFRQLRADGRFRKEMLFQHPPPETLGLALEADRCDTVAAVAPDSAAGRAGIRPGDRVVRVGGAPVITRADVQNVLDRIPDPGSVRLEVERAGRTLGFTLDLPAGWRRHDISWRASAASIPPTVGIWGEPLAGNAKRAMEIAPDRLALRVTFLFPGEEWARTRGGLRLGDVIVAVDGSELPAMTARQFHSHFRLTHEVGGTAALTVVREGRRVNLEVPCLEVREE